MSTILRITALFAALITVALWFFGGFNLGRTQWTVPVEHAGDDGRPRIVHEARFLPGIDFLLGGAFASMALVAVSRFLPGGPRPGRPESRSSQRSAPPA